MTDDLEDLRRRLVVGHKSDGRSVYDEAAKAELLALCRQPGASVSRLARECGGRVRKTVAGVVPAPAAFVAVALPPTAAALIGAQGCDTVVVMDMQARLPNGVAIDLRGVELRNVGEVIEALGRLRCSASTKG